MSQATPQSFATLAGQLSGLYYPADNARAALIMVGGAGGDLHGPSNVYEPLASAVQAQGFTALRLEYRVPNDLSACVSDVLTAIAALQARGIARVALVGWSFGGAVVITAGAASEEVVGVATIASQTYGTDGVSRLHGASLLLIHGTADTVLPDRCSRYLYAEARQPKELVLYDGDGHGIERHTAALLRKLTEWSVFTLANG